MRAPQNLQEPWRSRGRIWNIHIHRHGSTHLHMCLVFISVVPLHTQGLSLCWNWCRRVWQIKIYEEPEWKNNPYINEIVDNGAYFIQGTFYRHLWASLNWDTSGRSGVIIENTVLRVLTLLRLNYVLCEFFLTKTLVVFFFFLKSYQACRLLLPFSFRSHHLMTEQQNLFCPHESLIIAGFQTNKRQENLLITIWNQESVGSHHGQCGLIVYSLTWAQWQQIEVSNLKLCLITSLQEPNLLKVLITRRKLQIVHSFNKIFV